MNYPSDYCYVDLGTKRGGALGVAFAHHDRYGFPKAKKKQMLGVDAKEDFRKEIEHQGFQFEQGIIPKDFSWPRADVYMAWNFMEHLNGLGQACATLDRMIAHSNVGVWLLMPSFEEHDRTTLQRCGYDFPYVDWDCHRAPFQLKHVDEVVKANKRRVVKVEKDARHFHRDSSKLMPLREDVEPAKFNPSVPGGWEVAITLRSL